MNTRPTILLVDPRYYDVKYRINPWMQPALWARDPQGMQWAAVQAFNELKLALQGVGCNVMVAMGTAGLPDMVFPANAAIVLDGRALVARFRYPQRQGEEVEFLKLFKGLQSCGLLSAVEQLPESCYQEGAGDCIWDAHRHLFWAAYGPRSSEAALERISAFFSQEVVPMELASERCYHLDVCFCLLSGGEILYYPPALTAKALQHLRERVAPDLLIEATEDDLRHFSINAVSVDRKLVMGKTTSRLRGILKERGYETIEVDLSPFMLSGGGAYCMTLRLDRSSAARVTPHVEAKMVTA